MKTALVFGSSGLVGQQLVQLLIQNNSYQKIKLFVRKKPNIQNYQLLLFQMVQNSLFLIFCNIQTI